MTGFFVSEVSTTDQTQEAPNPKCSRDTEYLEVGPAVFKDSRSLGAQESCPMGSPKKGTTIAYCYPAPPHTPQSWVTPGLTPGEDQWALCLFDGMA